jgi:hypothetical protein
MLFLNFLACWWENPDSDPGGPKTYGNGSRSGTLLTMGESKRSIVQYRTDGLNAALFSLLTINCIVERPDPRGSQRDVVYPSYMSDRSERKRQNTEDAGYHWVCVCVQLHVRMESNKTLII